jgi:hypothetical protein
MSLFENDHYQWRETYFVLFRAADRPQADDVVKILGHQDDRFEVTDVNADEAGCLESLTLRSPEDSSAMDITYLTGEEVAEQIEELLRTVAKSTLNAEDRDKLNYLGECDSRFDIFHFEEVSFEGGGEDDILDPGALLLVMEQLAGVCQGIGVDPQSGSLMQ